MRAWVALVEQAIDFEEVIIDLRRPQRFAQLAQVGEFSPPASVPVLVTDTVTIFDSLAIMEFASEHGERPLLPVDIGLRARARSFAAWQHAGLSGLCPRLSFESSFYPDRRALTREEVDDCVRLFTVLEAELAVHGGAYLVGDLSLADIALIPTLVRLHAHRPDFSNYPLTQRRFERVLSRDSVCRWLDEARVLPPVLLEDYSPA